jgi:hypothetical protein
MRGDASPGATDPRKESTRKGRKRGASPEVGRKEPRKASSRGTSLGNEVGSKKVRTEQSEQLGANYTRPVTPDPGKEVTGQSRIEAVQRIG